MSIFDDLITDWAENAGSDGIASGAGDAVASVPDDGMGNVASAGAAAAPSTISAPDDGMGNVGGGLTSAQMANWLGSSSRPDDGMGNVGTGLSNADMANWQMPGSSGGAAAGGNDDFMTALMDKVKKGVFNPKDPLGSIAGLVGILANLRNMKTGGHNDLGMVSNLVNQAKGDPFRQANQIPAIGSIAPVRGRPASSFIAPAVTGPLSQIRKV